MSDNTPGAQHHDVICIGNAIMDILGAVEETFLVDHAVEKGGMNLIDEARADYLTTALEQSEMLAGGSAANTAYGIAKLGSKCGFVGQVKKDVIGDDFISDIEAGGVSYLGTQPETGPATACSIILVTPDTARSMNTFLGSTLHLSDAHLGDELSANIIYLEGYLFDAPAGEAIFKRVVEVAQNCGAKLALSLSDSWCVERHFDAMRSFVRDHADIIFSNEEEFAALMGGTSDEQITELLTEVDEVIITCGSKGANCYSKTEHAFAAAQPIGEVVDTTGAGDLFAAGYLYARTNNMSLQARADIASRCAGEVICHFGARPNEDLTSIIAA